MSSRNEMGEDIKVRLPKFLKVAVVAEADSRLTSESAVIREALVDYMVRRGRLAPQSQPAPAALAMDRQFAQAQKEAARLAAHGSAKGRSAAARSPRSKPATAATARG